MKKLFILMLVAFTIATSSCKKDDADSSASSGSWKLGTTEYKVAYSLRTNTSGRNPTVLFMFADATPTKDVSKLNTFNLDFQTPPTASGTFQLVGTVGDALTATQCELSVGNAGAAYAYIGSTVNIDVKVSNGKVTFTVPEITVKNLSGGADAKVTAKVTEK